MASHLESLSARFPQILRAAAPQPLTAGQIVLFNDSLSPDVLSVKDSTGLVCTIPKVLGRTAALTALSAVTTEIVGLSLSGVPANDLAVGRILRFRLWGVATNIATATTLTLRARLGAGTVNAVGGAASANAIVASIVLTTAAAAKTTSPFTYGADIAIYTTGTSGTCLGQINWGGGPAGAIAQGTTGLIAAVALNTTIANNLEFTLQVASSADVTATSIHGGTIELL